MRVKIISTSIGGADDLPPADQRTRQVAGLLGFGEPVQEVLSTAVGRCMKAALDVSDSVEVEYGVEEDSAGQVFEVAVRTAGSIGRPAPRAVLDGLQEDLKGGLDRLLVAESVDGDLEFVVGMRFCEGAPAVASEAAARVAAELARRSRPQSSFFEIQERHRELFEAMRELAETNRQLEEYTQEVSHDLKGPLTGILLANEVLRDKLARVGLDEGSDPDIARLVDIIRDNVSRSAALIDDLLTLAEAGAAPAEIVEVDLRETVNTVLRENALSIEEKSVEVLVDDDLGSLRGSPTHFYQLFSNLIRNALKYNDSLKPVVEVRRMGDPAAGVYTFLVRDNGSGIDPGELDRVFEPFARGSGGDTGIGLATAAKVCDLYGGRISAYNDGGACFRFTLSGLPDR